MNFRELLTQYKKNETRVMVNGMGTGDTRGLILEVSDDYIVYELLNIQTEKKSQKLKERREIKFIPILSISDISEGEKVKETKPEVQTGIAAPAPEKPEIRKPEKEETEEDTEEDTEEP